MVMKAVNLKSRFGLSVFSFLLCSFLVLTLSLCSLQVPKVFAAKAETTAVKETVAKQMPSADTLAVQEAASLKIKEAGYVFTAYKKTNHYPLTVYINEIRNNVISFAFTKPVIELTGDNKFPFEVTDPPFIIEPALNAKYTWIANNALMVSSDDFKEGAKYSVVFPKELTGLYGDGFVFFGTPNAGSYSAETRDLMQSERVAQTSFGDKYEFLYRPLTLVSSNQVQLTHDGYFVFALNFSEEVDSAAVEAHGKVKVIPLEELKKLKNDNPNKKLSKKNKDLYKSTSVNLEVVRNVRNTVYVKFKLPDFDRNQINFVFDSSFTSKNGERLFLNQDYLGTIKVTNMIDGPSVSSERQYDFPWSKYVAVSLGRPGRMQDIDKFIQIKPKVTFKTEPSDYGFSIFADFEKGVPYTVTLKPGLSSSEGSLTEPFQRILMFNDSPKGISFSGRGTHLSLDLPALIKLSSIGIDQIKLDAWRVFENNIPMLVNLGSDYKEFGNVLNFAKPVASGSVKLKSEKLDSIQHNLIDFKKLINAKSGVYFLRAHPADEEGYYRRGSQLVVLSDLGLSAKRNGDSLVVWVNSLAKAQPVKDVDIKIYSVANQLIASGLTDDSGFLTINLKGLDATVLTAQKDGDLSYLNFNDNLLGAMSVDFSGQKFITSGYEATTFMPRGIYKPGETVDFKVVLRNAKSLAPEKAFPVLWQIDSPTGQMLNSGSATINSEGTFAIRQEIPFTANTGNYSIKVFLPGEEKEMLAYDSFLVEDFIPPRLKIDLAFSKEKYVVENKIELDATVKYLFGAVGANLEYEAGIRLDEYDYSHKDWRGYSFASDSVDFNPIVDAKFAKGNLDEQGKTKISYSYKNTIPLPQVLSFTTTFRAMDDGGRWLAKRESVFVYPKPVLLGINLVEASKGKPFVLNALAINPDASVANTEKLTCEFFKIQRHSFLMENEDYRRAGSAYEYHSLQKVDIKLQAGKGTASFTPDSSGDYVVKITDPVSGAVGSKRFYVYSGDYGNTDNSAIDKVTLSFDKKEYKIGDTAKITVVSPFSGRLVLTIGNSSEFFSRSLDMEKTETIVEVPITAEFKPQAFCTAWVSRAIEPGKEWSSHRAFGVGRIQLDFSDKKINVDFKMPEILEPARPVTVKIKLSDFEGKPVKGEFSLALVDEAVLNLTKHRLTDLFSFFYGNRSFNSFLYDVYNLLMPLETAIYPILQVGGDAMASPGDSMPNYRRKQEILSIFMPALTTDEKGEASVILNVPEYSGRARLSVIALSGDKFGSKAESVEIKRDVVVESTVPLVLAPNDEFIIPVKVFVSKQTKEKSLDIGVNILVEGPISLATQSLNEFKLQPGETKTLYIKAKATPSTKDDESVGIAQVHVMTTVKNQASFKQSIETVVRSPYPFTTKVDVGTFSEGKTDLDLNRYKFLSGTERRVLSVAPSPAVNLLSLSKFLERYPYGCLEQTISRGWNFLSVPDMLASLNPDFDIKEHGAVGLKKTLLDLLAMNTYSGGFNYWPGKFGYMNEWGSVYAAHFLTDVSQSSSVPIPGNMLKNSLTWLREYLSSSNDNMEDSYWLSTKAYACYVLALNGDYQLGWMQFLSDNQKNMYESGRIFLAGAYSIYKGNASPLRELNLKGAMKEDGGYRRTLESSLRNKALQLMVWNQVEPNSKEATTLALDIAKEIQRPQYFTTQEAGVSLMALSKYLRLNKVGEPYKLNVTDSKDNIILTATEKAIATAGDRLLSGVDKLVVDFNGKGNAYYSLNISGVPLEAPDVEANGMELKRYFILSNDTMIDLNVAQDKPQVLKVKKGDRIIVKLVLQNKNNAPLKDVVIADLLAGGFELEGTALLSDAPTSSSSGYNSDYDEEDEDGEDFMSRSQYNAPSVRFEQREDRVIIVDPFVSDSTSYTYAMRAVHDGTFVLPPTSAACMYSPEYRAILSSAKVIVE